MYLFGDDCNALRTIRAGVIPFTIKNNRLYFLLGVYRDTGELTDFGGGVKTSESIIDAAYRELFEESCKIFDDSILKTDLNRSIVITNTVQNMAIFFLYLHSEWLQKAEVKFNTSQKTLI